MKKNWKLAFAAFTFVAFTACNSDNENTTETENIEATEEMDAELNSEIGQDTVMLDDATTEGANEMIKEEEPPVQ